MPDRDDAFFEKTVSGDIDVSICHDGMLYVDGREVVNIFDIIKKLNEKLLDAIDCLYEGRM